MILSSSTLTHNPVRNAAGEDLGKIEDFMINTSTGEVEYAVLSFGGFMGMGDKLFAVPLQAMQVDPDEEAFVLDESKERLKDAPGFDKDHWPRTPDAAFRDKIGAYYGL